MKNTETSETKEPNSAPYGETIRYMAYNEYSGQNEQVYPESEIPDTQLVIPYFWHEPAKQYFNVPGTEFYGPVPAEGK